MDRFEATNCKQLIRDDIQIYIPVWIDLKTTNRHHYPVRFRIYIPVWIDLKARFGFLLVFLLNLHSSMDRFEEFL